jgi:MinD superfamily P-loop ATPase
LNADNSLIIYDSPPGTSCPVIETTKEVDFVVLVTEPTPFGLHDLKLAVETMRLLKKDSGVVINRDGIGNEDVVAYCAAEHIPLLARIPYDVRIARLYAKGGLIYPHIQEFREQLVQLASKLMK